MKTNSKYFDSIRVSSSPKRKKKQPKRVSHPPCQWKGCDKDGAHRAPKGRGRDNEYFQFCIDHVRQYNANYNYFDGMNDDAVEDFLKDSVTGNRPTWKVASHAASLPRDRYSIAEEARTARETGNVDPHGIFAAKARKRATRKSPAERHVRKLEMKALLSLNLDAKASREEIKARFKILAKRYHPDGNGGDRGSEEKLREVIQAYNYLKQAGHV